MSIISIKNKLVSSWPINELSGENIEDVWGSNNAISYGTIINSTDPKLGTACRTFDGLNDYIVATGYKGVLGTAPRSFTAWIRTSSNDTQTIFSYGWAGGAFQHLRLVLGPENNLFVRTIGGVVQWPTPPIVDNNWHHVVMVIYDGGIFSEMDVYLDGQLLTSSNPPGGNLNTVGVDDFTIGARSYLTGAYFNGDIDAAHFFDDALTSEEISILYNDGIGVEIGVSSFSKAKLINAGGNLGGLSRSTLNNLGGI